MIRVKFFAGLREALACEYLDVQLSSPLSVATLRDHLIDQHPHWARHLDDRLLCAVNYEVARTPTMVCDGDEVAFFPPVTGG